MMSFHRNGARTVAHRKDTMMDLRPLSFEEWVVRGPISRLLGMHPRYAAQQGFTSRESAGRRS